MMIDEQLEKRWESCRDGQILVDASHPLKMLLSISENENKQLLVPTKQEIRTVKSSRAIIVSNATCGMQNYLVIELINPMLKKEYVYLCIDLIEKSRKIINEKDALKTLLDTFSKWQQLFDATKQDLLSIMEIKGLIGELLFIESELKSAKNAEDVFFAWKTHKDAARDFIYDDIWYEIKSMQSTSDYITISSIDQLDHDSIGELLVYFIDKRHSLEGCITLPTLVSTIKDQLSIGEDQTEFMKKLLSKGYIYYQEYDQLFFECVGKKRYIVNTQFPALRKECLPEQVLSAKYELSIAGIKGWLIGE